MGSHDSLFSATVSHENGYLLLHLAGELDVATAPALQHAVGELVGPQLRGLTLDLEGLSFVAVAGLRAFCGAREAAASVGATFSLCSVGDRTLRVIRLADFEVLQNSILPTPGASAA
jgi:anti-sigma B factor antagonist